MVLESEQRKCWQLQLSGTTLAGALALWLVQVVVRAEESTSEPATFDSEKAFKDLQAKVCGAWPGSERRQAPSPGGLVSGKQLARPEGRTRGP